MATYNKRGYKEPKEKVKEDAGAFVEEQVNVDEKDSTTAAVFSKLDESANKTEDWVQKNQKMIISVLGGIAIVVVGYLLYQKFVVAPKEDTAAEEMFIAQQNFKKALDAPKPDSLYNLALNGSEGKFGFAKIAEEYSGTDAGNMANYYAGVSYLNLKKYPEAIASLEKYKGKDVMTGTLAVGLIGDAYAQQGKNAEALEQYLKAVGMNANEFTTPRFLMKAGQVELAMGKKADALKHFTELKEKYELSPEASNVDALIGLAQ
ncbi:Tetratricopeptide repeat-containing protein [Flavobacterium longum]|uniref:tetratricopeptide repeat protein n=1 Tax=Flavobacterium longum TaxID=1299340 RepID=UPI0039EA32C1